MEKGSILLVLAFIVGWIAMKVEAVVERNGGENIVWLGLYVPPSLTHLTKSIVSKVDIIKFTPTYKLA